MNLDPTVSPWVGIFASTGVCLWMAAIGAPLSKAVFGDRPRPVWPFYAPALGIVTVLLTTNLSAYVIPGAPSAWFGLLAPSALAAVIAWRTQRIRIPSRRTALALLVLVLACAGTYVAVFVSRTQTFDTDAAWHHAIALRLARGAFPPVTPYGPDAGMGYHYGHNLLAASIVNVASVPAWSALVVLESYLVVVLVLSGIGLARDKGGSLTVSLGVGSILGLTLGIIRVVVPPFAEFSGQSNWLSGLYRSLVLTESGGTIEWLYRPQFTIAISILILIAAALDIRSASRSSIVLGMAFGSAALASASVLIFSSAALVFVGVIKLACVRGRDRLVLTSALMIGGLLVALAGGPVSDALLSRGGSAGMVRIGFEPNWTDLVLFSLEEQVFIRLGILPLLAVSAIAAYQLRSWGLWYLTATGVLGIVASTFVQSPIPSNDGRLIYLATAVAGVAALSGLASLIEFLGNRWRVAVTLSVFLIVVLPTALPRATSGVRLASDGLPVMESIAAVSRFPFVGQTPGRWELFREDIEQNWDFYSWLESFLPKDARLLTTHPAVVASAAGVAAPTSGHGLQVLSPRVAPVYEDALRFLHRDDLADMRTTHVHLTDTWESTLSSEARSLLSDPAHFRLLADVRSDSGQRHWILEVVPGAGTTQVHPGSFRALRETVKLDQPFKILDGLTLFQRQMLLYTLIDHPELQAPATLFGRSTRLPKVNPVSDISEISTVALSVRIDPTMLGLTGADEVWTGYGVRVLDLASSWSRAWRVSADFPAPIERFRALCERSSTGELSLKILGESGDKVSLGNSSIRLTGKTQTADISVGECKNLRLSEQSGIRPFAQVRAQRSDGLSLTLEGDATLGFDGHYSGNLIILNILYTSLGKSPHRGAAEFRLYEVGPIGVTPESPSPLDSKRWWPSALDLASEIQEEIVEFDPEKLKLNGDHGGGVTNRIITGRTYLLTLNVTVIGGKSGLAVIQQQIPVARFKAGSESSEPEVFSAIVPIRNPVESSGLAHEYSSKIGFETNRTPGFETDEVFR